MPPAAPLMGSQMPPQRVCFVSASLNGSVPSLVQSPAPQPFLDQKCSLQWVHILTSGPRKVHLSSLMVLAQNSQ
ncbi:hypothetical protein XELAEV_18041015mg [Xenopus laevis]|uniref:Uncharacterized protein n=1 Tax=Xenopus laevis TaxID=8355 RepID=A0A974C1V2_XENLA|nr:hypothetical protein XELAEV_18041015mg [Xenopus laevis]